MQACIGWKHTREPQHWGDPDQPPLLGHRAMPCIQLRMIKSLIVNGLATWYRFGVQHCGASLLTSKALAFSFAIFIRLPAGFVGYRMPRRFSAHHDRRRYVSGLGAEIVGFGGQQQRPRQFRAHVQSDASEPPLSKMGARQKNPIKRARNGPGYSESSL